MAAPSASASASAPTGRLSGLVAIVTGGSAGIGAGCVRRLHAEGAAVVFCSNAPAEGAALEAALGPQRALFMPADCREAADVARVVTTAAERFGAVDCLVNNVGSHPASAPIDDIAADDFRRLFELNVMSGFLFTQRALPHLRRSRRAPSVVNISSTVNPLGQAGAVSYVATKGAVSAMTRALAIDEAAHGVRVNTVSPSCIDTPLLRHCVSLDTAGPDQATELLTRIAKQQLNGRLGTPDDVAGAVAFLVSEDASFITGIDLYVSGGGELSYGEKAMTRTSMSDK